MPTSAEPPRRRRVWVWATVLVALVLVVPVGLFLGRDDTGPSGSDAGRLTGSPTSAPAETPTEQPSTAETTEPTPVPKGKPRALFFGDSYFIGGGYTDASNSMAQLAANKLGWSAAITGGGGTGFVQGNPEYNLPNFLGQIENGAFDVGRRSWVVIEGGNDDRFLDQKVVGKNARKVIRIAQRRFPSATIVIVGPLDTDGDFSDTTPVAKTMRKAAAKREVAFVDARAWLKGHYDLIGPDYTHPYPEGHKICARKLTRALRNLGA